MSFMRSSRGHFGGFGHGGGFGRHGGSRGHSFRRPQQGHRWHRLFAPAQPDPQVQWAQGCLAQSDPSVPQDGIMGPETRQALQTFQSQQQLPATGMLDAATVSALQATCSGAQGAGSGAAPPGVPAPPSGRSASGHQRSHEIATEGEGEFPGQFRFGRDFFVRRQSKRSCFAFDSQTMESIRRAKVTSVPTRVVAEAKNMESWHCLDWHIYRSLRPSTRCQLP